MVRLSSCSVASRDFESCFYSVLLSGELEKHDFIFKTSKLAKMKYP